MPFAVVGGRADDGASHLGLTTAELCHGWGSKLDHKSSGSSHLEGAVGCSIGRRPAARSGAAQGHRVTSVGNGIARAVTRGAFITTLEETLGVEPGALKMTDTRETVKGWSSLTDVTILTVIFSELGIEAEEDLLDYKTVGDLLEILDSRTAFSDS